MQRCESPAPQQGRTLQIVCFDVLATTVSAVKPLARSLCQPAKPPQTSSFKRKGRNSRKQKQVFFVFPELAQDSHVPARRKPGPTAAIITGLLQDLRVPSVSLPVRYFLEADNKRSKSISESDAGCSGTKDPKGVIAVPDTRGMHKAGDGSRSPASMRAQARAVESLRSLVTLMRFASDVVQQDPGFVAASFASIDRMVRAAAAAQYARFPRALSSALPHVSIAAQWQSDNDVPGAATSRTAQLLPESALRVSQEYLLSPLDRPEVLQQLSSSHMADIAAALSVLQPHSASVLAPAFWTHLRRCAEQEGHKLRTPACMGDASRISSVVQQARTVLPPEAHSTATLLHASRTWLQPSQSQATVATIPNLCPTDTIWCFLAMHTPYLWAQAQPGGENSILEDALKRAPLGMPWDWVKASRVAVARARYSNSRKDVLVLLRERIEKMSPGRVPDSKAVATGTRGKTISAIPSQPTHVSSDKLVGLRLKWPEHAPVILAGLSMPITPSMQRSALRPLLAASAASIAHSKDSNNAASLDATQTGHWVALLDLTSASLAAMSTQHSRAAEALVTTACEELQAQVSGMTTRHVASSVLLLGEILTKQGHRRSITCDAAYQYLASIFRCKTMNESDMSVPDVLMLSAGIQKLCGARSKHIWCSQQKQHLQRAGTGPTTKDASGFGRPLPVPRLQTFAKSVASRSLRHVGNPSLETAEATASILNMLGSVRLPYQQVVPFLRRGTAVLHDHLKARKGADLSTKALAHILLSLGDLHVPFDTVYPLVLTLCDVLHDRSRFMDATEVYLIVDGLVKLRAPTPEVAPLLLSMMAHLTEGLDIRPTKPALHMHLLTTPPSQLLKLAHGIKSFMPQTHGLLTRDMQAAPKAAFIRSLLSHIMRLRLADLTHRDLLHVLQLVKDSSLGRDLPKPWTQDSALRILDRFNAHLFNGRTKTVPDTMYWQNQPLLDLMYTGSGAPPPPPMESSEPSSSMPPYLFDSGSAAAASTAGVRSVALHSRERQLVSEDLLLSGASDGSPSAVDSAVPGGFDGDVRVSEPLHGSTWREEATAMGRDPWSDSEDLMRPESRELHSEVNERWAYRKVFSVVHDSTTVILGSLRALDWDSQVTHAVKTITENIGPRGLHAPAPVLDRTLPTASTRPRQWRQIQYTGQDCSPEELRGALYGRGRVKDKRGGGRGRSGGRGKPRVRWEDSEFRKRQLAPLETPDFVPPTVPTVESMDLSRTSTATQLLCGFRAVDCSRLLVAVAELYSDSAAAGRSLMHEVGPRLFSMFPPEKHNVPDLARMIWALGVLARPGCGLEQALPALHTAIERCQENITALDPKFTMLAAKGLGLLARGGKMMHGAEIKDTVWPALAHQVQKRGEASSADEQFDDASKRLTVAAKSFVSDAIAHLGSPDSRGDPIALKLRPEGLSEVLTAATLLSRPSRIQQLRDLWEVAVGALEVHPNPEDVPLRATSGLLATVIHILHTNSSDAVPADRLGNSDGDERAQRGLLKQQEQQKVRDIQEQHQRQHQRQHQQLLQQQLADRVHVIERVSRERLLHNKRKATVPQLRNFSARLHTLARAGIPVTDGGLVKALVALSVSAPAVMNAKQRGIGGASRLVEHLEDLAALGSHGVVFCGSGSRGGRRGGAAQRGRVEVAIDASLSQCMSALREGVELAVLRDGAHVPDDSTHVSAHIRADVNGDAAMDCAVSSGELSSSSTTARAGEGDSLSTSPSSNETMFTAHPDAQHAESHPADSSSQHAPVDSEGVHLSLDPGLEEDHSDGSGEQEEMMQEGTEELEEAVLEEKAEETLQALVDGKDWRRGAWSPQLAARLTVALDTLSGGDDGRG